MGIQRSTIKFLGERPATKFVIVPKELLRDTEISADALRVAAYLLSLDDGWTTNQRSMATATGMPLSNLRRVNNAVKNLVARGWLRITPYRDGNGRLYKYEYLMHRSRRIDKPTVAAMAMVADGESKAESGSTVAILQTLYKDHSKGPAEQGHLDRDLLAPSGAGGGKDLEVLETRVAQWSGLKMADQAPAVTQAPPRSVTEERDTNVPPLVGQENSPPFVSQSNCYGCGAVLGDDIAPDPAGMLWHRQCAADLQCVPECTVDGHRCHLVGPRA